MISIKSSTVKLSLCIGIIGIPSIALIAYILKKNKNFNNDSDEQYDTIIKTRQKIIELKVPKHCVKSIIGRNGSVIKEIQAKTNTRINLKDRSKKNENNKDESNNDESDRILLIRGASMNVGLAELEIKKLILDLPVELTEEYYVPDYACGRIIGKGGSNIREISSLSNCVVKLLDRLPKSTSLSSSVFNSGSSNKISSEMLNDKNMARKVISLTGGYEQIMHAKELILAKIKEENDFREKKILKQLKNSNSLNDLKNSSSISSSLNKINSETKLDSKVELADSKIPNLINIESYLDRDKKVSVYCTAVANPLIFWVQLSRETLTSLKKLNQDMKNFYINNVSSSIDFANINELKKGQLVACRYISGESEMWYRAEIIEPKPNPNNQNEVDVYFVDYGNSDYVLFTDLKKLDRDFFTLPFQAIECTLSDIELNDMNNNKKDWSEEDMYLFEDLVYSCKYKKLKLEFCGTVENCYNPNLKKVSCKLFDEEKNAYISDLLIQNGCAKSKFIKL